MALAAGAEADAGGYHHAFPLHQQLSHGRGRQVRRVAGEQEGGAFGQGTVHAGDPGQAAGAAHAQVVALIAPRGQVILGALEGGDPGHLHEGRNETGGLFLDLEQGVQQVGLSHDAAQPPAGHGVGLGEGVAGEGAFRHALQVGDGDVAVGVVEEVLVGLVAEDEQVALPGQARHGGQFVLGVHAAGGVVGVVDDDELGARGDVLVQPVVADVVLLLLAEGHGDGDALGHLDLLAEADPGGLEHQHFIAGLDVGVDGLVQAHLAAGGDQDVAVGVDGAGIVGGELFGHGVAKLGQAAGGADVGVAGVEGGDPGVDDVPGGHVVRAGLAEVDYVVTLAGQLAGFFAGGQGGRGLHALDAGGGGSGHGPPLWCW